MTSPSDNPVQEGERQATATGPLVLPVKFNGTGNFNEWISHFEGIAAINKWTDDDKGLWLKVRLTDKAHVALMRLPNDAHESYASLKAALKERFEPSSKQEVYKAEFESRRKRSTESWGDFGDELLQLVDKGFPSLQPEAKEQLALSRYLGQLAPAEVAFGVKQRRPATVNEVVSSTIELESYLSKTLPKNNSVSHVTDEEDQVVGSVQSVQEEVEVMGKLHTEDDNHTWMVENASTAPIIVARALVKPKSGLIPLRLINTNLIPVKVYQGSTVAQAELLDELTINVVSENSMDQPSPHQPVS